MPGFESRLLTKMTRKRYTQMTPDEQLHRISESVRDRIMKAMSNVTEENKKWLDDPDFMNEWEEYLIRIFKVVQRVNKNEESILIPEPQGNLNP